MLACSLEPCTFVYWLDIHDLLDYMVMGRFGVIYEQWKFTQLMCLPILLLPLLTQIDHVWRASAINEGGSFSFGALCDVCLYLILTPRCVGMCTLSPPMRRPMSSVQGVGVQYVLFPRLPQRANGERICTQIGHCSLMKALCVGR